MAAGAAEQIIDDLGCDSPVGRAEPVEDETGEGLGGNHPQLDRLGAAPKGLVGVVEYSLHHVLLAPQVDVGHLGLFLERRAQELG